MSVDTDRYATASWVRDLRWVADYGTESSPRGQKTREILSFQSMVDMTRPVVVSGARKLGYKFMAAEAAWIMSGDDRVETIAPYSREISKFSDDGVKFFGAYGPKLLDQVDRVVGVLIEDPDSRQAVVNIWRENPPKTKDVPCTVSVQWLIRSGKLYCVDFMRSSDLWLGHPYDVFNFSMVSLGILSSLRFAGMRDLGLGHLTMVAGSKHLYDRDFDKVRAVLDEFDSKDPDEVEGPVVDPDKFKNYNNLVEHLWRLAREGGADRQESWT